MEALIAALASITTFITTISLALLLAPNATLRLIHHRHVETPGPRPIRKYRIERFFYRNHRWFGLTMIVGGLYTLFQLGFSLDLVEAQKTLGTLFPAPQLGAWLVESGIVYLWATNLFVLVLGFVVVLRPSLLKGFESWSNTPVSELRPIAQSRSLFEQWLHRHPRQAAVFLLVGTFYVVTMFTFYLKLSLQP